MIHLIDANAFVLLLDKANDKVKFIKTYFEEYTRDSLHTFLDEEHLAEILMEIHVLKKELIYCVKSKDCSQASLLLQEFNGKVLDMNNPHFSYLK